MWYGVVADFKKQNMDYKELKKIGEWLNTKGYGIDLTDDFWMEEYDWGEHKTRDICQMLFDYHTEQCNIANVVRRSEQLLAVAEYVYNHFDNSSSKTAKDYLQDFLSQ